MQNQRSPISEYIPLSQHDAKEYYSGGLKRKRNVSSTILLIVNNWHFNRDVMSLPTPIKCCPEDCSIQIKLSSTAFKGDSNTEEAYHFDKNGLVLPYAAFVWLCDEGKAEMSGIISEIQRLYQLDVSPSAKPIALNIEGEAAEEENNAKKAKKVKK